MLHTQPDASRIDCKYPIPEFTCAIDRAACVGRNTGIVMRGIESPIFLDNGCNGIRHRRFVAHVGFQDQSLASAVHDELSRLLRHDRIMVKNCHASTTLGKTKCRSPSDAAAAPRDEGDTTGKIDIFQLLSPVP